MKLFGKIIEKNGIKMVDASKYYSDTLSRIMVDPDIKKCHMLHREHLHSVIINFIADKAREENVDYFIADHTVYSTHERIFDFVMK